MDFMLGTIMWVTMSWAPQGTLLADGQCLPVNPNAALYSLMGTTYGGDGRNNFCLPDLRPKDKDGKPMANWNNGLRAVVATQGIYPSRP